MKNLKKRTIIDNGRLRKFSVDEKDRMNGMEKIYFKTIEDFLIQKNNYIDNKLNGVCVFYRKAFWDTNGYQNWKDIREVNVCLGDENFGVSVRFDYRVDEQQREKYKGLWRG